MHTHSHHSDGTSSPARVIADAKAAGLDVVALTDHDTTAGWFEAAGVAAAAGIGFVPGMEISTRMGGVPIHLLSYLHDPTDPALIAEADKARASRLGRARAMVELINADYPLTWASVLEHVAPGATAGRPYIGDALVAAGHVPDRPAAFARILGHRAYRVPHYSTDTVTAVRLVRAAGGVPVIAHPGADRGHAITDAMIEHLAGAGLVGIEVDHRDNPPARRTQLQALAHRLDLIVTGSSDYHGAGKPNQLGEYTTTPEALEHIWTARGNTSVWRSLI
ncbi:PHP domain-containing protein [Oerskovia sp. Root22]|uniref:PHP domain-containing protein n=1 Tax=Oerskovia sp. Root22 TaxID=1736494 RepID=UPI001F3809A7|nr:PHP domain-containing protein [Oerskovia sp. Root22]